jgi:DNA-binding transcriptional LysR family regulator
MVDRGLGVSLVPDWALSWPSGHALAKKPLPHAFARRSVGLVWTRGSARMRLVEALLRVLKRQKRGR